MGGDNDDRFGIPEINIQAAMRSATMQSKYSIHTYVPTRKEVRNLSLDQLSPILIGWMNSGAIEIIPSRHQIMEVKNILTGRDDFHLFSQLIVMCNHYIGHN